jgi:hypothetical protein
VPPERLACFRRRRISRATRAIDLIRAKVARITVHTTPMPSWMLRIDA